MRLIISTVIAVALGAGLALSQDRGGTESRPSGDQIRAQVKNLDNDAFDIRTKAMDELRALGEAARAELEAAKASPSLEMRTRAETLLKELDAKKAGAHPQTDLRPVAPEAEGEARAGQQRGRNVAPRVDDYRDPQAYVEALHKWIEEQLDKDTRFPRGVLPEPKDLDLGKAFGKDWVIVGPDDPQFGGTMSVTQQKNGETTTFKSGPGGVTLRVLRKNEAGEPVVETFPAKDIEEFKTKYPELWEKYDPMAGSGRGWTFRSGGRTLLPGPRAGVPLAPPPPLAPVLAPTKLGVFASAVPPVLDKQLKLKGEGVVIDKVEPDSLASRMGLQEHDVLLQLNGQVIHERDDILREMTKKDPPATMTAKIVREGAVILVSAAR